MFILCSPVTTPESYLDDVMNKRRVVGGGDGWTSIGGKQIMVYRDFQKVPVCKG